MSASATPNGSDFERQIRKLVLEELPSLRLDRDDLEAAMDEGRPARIPSRKAMVIIARVCRAVGVGKEVVKKSDLRPDQVTNLPNLIDLLYRRAGTALGMT